MHPPNIIPALEMHVKQARSKRSTRTNPPGAYPRLTQPLVRDNGVLRPASWDEALDRAADGFRRNLSAHGRECTGIFSCSKSTNEVNFMAAKFARAVFGNNNVDSCNRT
jgi:predicted molibdopterin-dependent oxidoreductase YjgC